jgi:hypothetical protein
LLTLVYARRLHGAPRLVPLANTGLRALLIAAIAALAAALAIETLAMGAAALLQIAVGGLAFGVATLLGARLIGDPPIREAIARAASIRRRSS